MSTLLGFILIIAGIYFLGQNIIFATIFFPYGYRSLPALGSVLSIIAGVITLVFFPKVTNNLGWIFLGSGIMVVFLSGGVILKPASLSNFVVSFTALAVGYKLINERRFRF